MQTLMDFLRGDVMTWIALGLAWLAHMVAFSLVVIHCLRHRRDPSVTVLWVLVAWGFPLLGPLCFLALGVNRIPRKAWRKRRSDQAFLSERRAREDAAMPLVYWQSVHDAVAAELDNPFARELDHVMDGALKEYPLLGGNSAEPLVTGDEAFPRMLEAIDSAKHHVHLQTFIVGHDTIGREFLECCKRKAESGVRVRFLYDRFGSTHALLGGLIRKYRGIPNLHLVGWTQANPIKRQFQVNLRNHRKVLIVDGTRAFAGGINLQSKQVTRDGKEPDRDYHFELGGPIVQELQYAFLRDWYFMTDEDPEVLLVKEHFPHLPATGPALVRVVKGGPSSETQVMTDILFAAIVAARKQLLAVTPYLVPTDAILQAFRSAALRGVEVKLVVPQKNNHIYAGMAGRALYDDLLSAGVRIFERRPPFIHAKALIVDDMLAIVGTANLDVRSLRLNYEINLAVYDDGFINAMKRIVLEDVARSEELDLKTWRARPTSQQMAENFCHLLSPVL